MRRRILCFGDSNTWGYSPLGERFDETVRWPMVMAGRLGDEFMVIEEGLNGRTTVLDDPTEGGFKSGLSYLPPCLMTHNPLDLVILMLGTNDTKQRFSLNAYCIAQGMLQLLKAVHQHGVDRENKPPTVLLVSPILIGDNITDTAMGPIFGEVSYQTSLGLAEEYRKLALMMGVEYLNAAEVAQPSRLDAVHMTREGQAALAEAVTAKVLNIFGKA